MNKIYRLIWSNLLNTWVAVAENTRARGKDCRSASRALVCASIALSLPAIAAPPDPAQLPTGGQVAAGQVGITQSGATMNITQTTQRGVVNWNTFNVGAQAQVNFVQPSAASVTLNRVQDANPSQIFGRITANGQVFLTNPNGVYFSPTASVDVGGLVATTHGISDADFMAGKTAFARNGATGTVINEGNLKALLGGYIALLAPEVRNNGVIIAQLGTAVLAAGESITLNFSANNTLAGITVTPSQIKALVENKQVVLAPGGLIILSAMAANSLQGGVVNNAGRLEANGLVNRGGKIILEASSQINNSGSITANATLASGLAGGPAGSINIAAPQITNSGAISANASIQGVTGGRILLDAANILQTATGSLDVSSGRAVNTGGLILKASQDISLSGSLNASANSVGLTGIVVPMATGGDITIQAGNNVTLETAVLDASGSDGGGRIHIEGGGRIHIEGGKNLPNLPPVNQPAVAFLGATEVRVSSRRGNGGSVTVTGDNIALLDTTRIDATGATGGGTINVGGGWQGGGGIAQSTAVYVSRTATLDASAIGTGNGGEVTVWSDIHNTNSATRAYGTLLAKGGANGGNGGRIETSGHWVDVAGITANASALKGLGGEWLLDPYNLTISAAATTTTNLVGPPYSFSSGAAGTTNVLNTDIQAQLNAGTSVTLQTTGVVGDGAGNGDINVNASIAKTAGGTTTLLLKAHNDIIVAANVSISSSGVGNALNVTLNSDSDASGAGAIAMNAGSSISTNGGNITLGGGANPLANYAFGSATNSKGVWLDVGSSLNSAGGNISLRGTGIAGTAGTWSWGVQTVAGAIINSGAGTILIDGVGPATGGTTSAFGGSIFCTITSANSTANAISITGVGPTAGVNSNGAVGLNVSADIQATNGGGITLSGTGGPTSTSFAYGIYLANTNILSTGGAITLTGNAQAAGFQDIFMGGNVFIGQKAGTTVTTSASNITLNADKLSISATDRLQSSGTLTIAPRTAAATIGIGGGAGTLQLAASYFSTNFVNGFSGITIGSATAGNITVGGATTYNDPLTIKSAGSIVLNSSLSGTAGQLAHLTLWSDADVSGSGAIWMNAGSSITTNGGNIVMGGGLDPLTGYAVGDLAQPQADGINLSGTSTLSSAGGNISIRGKSAAGSGNVQYVGILSSANIDSGAGTITLDGISQGAGTGGGTTNAQGIAISGMLTSANATAGAILLTGSSTSAGAGAQTSVGINSTGTIQTTNGGGITLTGTGGNSYVASNADGLCFGGNILSNSGPITLTGIAGIQSSGFDIRSFFNNAVVGSAVPAASSSNITLNANTLSLRAVDVFQSSGALTIQPRTVSTTIGVGASSTSGILQLPQSYFWNGATGNFKNGFSGITIGSATGTGLITVGGLSFYDPLTIQSGAGAGAITVAGAVTDGITGLAADQASLTLKAGADIVMNAASSITTHGQAVTLNSDTDQATVPGGAIVMNTGSSISTNGGNIVLGGGADPMTGYAIGDAVSPYGVYLGGNATTALTSAGGNISIRGKSSTSSVWTFGIYSFATINSGAGTITLDGIGQGTGASNNQSIVLDPVSWITSANTTANAISITGTYAGASNTAETMGINAGGTIQATNGGGITLTGTGGSSTTATQFKSDGIYLYANVLATGGPITLTGTRGSAAGGTVDVWIPGGTIGGLALANSSSPITVNADTVGFSGNTFQSSGALTIQPRTAGTTIGLGASSASGILQLPQSYFWNGTTGIFKNGFSGITIGSATGTGLITVGGLTFYDPLTIQSGAGAGAITVAGAVTDGITGLAADQASLTLKAGADILMNAATSITTHGQSVTLNSDSDVSLSGAIVMNTGSSIITNGGNIVMGGGVDPTVGYSYGNSINNQGIAFLSGASLNSGGGNISMRGTSFSSAVGLPLWGVLAEGNITSGAGTILMDGISMGTGGSNAQGLAVGVGTITSANSTANAITINGRVQAGGANTFTAMGLNLYGNIFATNGGGISLNGTGAATTAAAFGEGIYVQWNAKILANSGAITLTGNSPTAGLADINFVNNLGSFVGQDGVNVIASSSNITLNANSLTLSATDRLQSSGTLTIAPRTAGTTIGIGGGAGTLQLAASYFSTNFVNGFSGITIGSATAGNIIASGLTFSDNLTLWAGNPNATATLSGAIANAGPGLLAGSLTVKAAGDITSTAAITTQTQNITLNSDSDGVGGGGILLNAGSSISSLGGSIVMGGGVNPLTGYATGTAGSLNSGIHVLGNITAGVGSVTMHGQSALGDGLTFAGGTLASDGITTINGTTSMAGGGSAATTIAGVNFRNAGTRLTTAAGTVTITGITSSNNWSQGVTVDAATIETTGSGSLTLNGTDTFPGTGAASWGFGLNSGGLVRSTGAAGGSLNFNSSSGDWGSVLMSGSITSNGGAVNMTDQSTNGIFLLGAGGINAGTNGSISLTADKMSISNPLQATGGTLSIKPFTAGTTIGIAGGAGTLALTAANFASNFMTGFTGITIGSATAGAITVGGAVSANDNLALISGGAININAALSDAVNKTLTLTGGTTVSGAGNISATNLLLNGAGTYNLNTAAANSVGTLAATGVAGLSYTNSGALTIGGIVANGAVSLETLNGDLTISSDIAALGGLFVNAGKSAAAGTASGGNILFSSPPGFAPPMVALGIGTSATLMTGSIAASTGVAAMAGPGNSRYNSDEVTTNYTSALTAGVFANAIYREQPVVIVTANAVTKTYDGLAYAGGAGVTYAGFVNGETQAVLGGALTYGGTSQNAINAGGYLITPGGLNNGLGYGISYVNGALTVNKAALTVTANAATRTYGAVNPVFTETISGYVNAETSLTAGVTGASSLTTTATTATNVGTAVITAGAGTLAAANYNFNTMVNGTLTVNPATLTLSGTKVYDGTTSFAGGNLTAAGVAGETFAITGAGSTGNLASKNVQTGVSLANLAGLALGVSSNGGLSSNYNALSAAGSSVSISARALTITAAGVNKVYDGLTTATETLTDNRIAGDVLTAGLGTASFLDKNAANGKAVSVSGITLTGVDAGNYTFNSTAATTANITPAILTITAAGVNKVYDGLTTATETLTDNRIAGDVLTAGLGVASFLDKNAANGKAVSVSGITLNGVDAANYTFNSTAATTANITPAVLTITAAGVNKMYDGLTMATETLSDNRIAGDVLTAGLGVASFLDKNAAIGKIVNVSGITLTGVDAGNYTFNTTAATTANITPAILTITAAGVNKVYDGLTTATETLTDNRIAGDVLTTGLGTASFLDKNAAIGKIVNVSGITLTGVDAGNYTFNTTAATTANITPAVLTITAAGVNKVYDGLTTATETLTDNRIAGDVLTTGLGVASFLDKNAANGKAVSVSGITLTGVDAGNYTFNTTAATTANITPATLTIAANAAAKVFDGIAYAGGAGVTYTGFMNGETSAVLLGALSYGGTSQGANFAGSYLITPGGLTGNNYSVGYINGALMISAPPVMPTVLPPPAFLPPVVTTVTAPQSNQLVILPASTHATQPASVPTTAAQPAATSGTQPVVGTQLVSGVATPTTTAGATPAANQNGSGGVGSGGGLPVASKPVAQPAVGSTSAKQNAAVANSGEPAITPDAGMPVEVTVTVTPKVLSTILAASDRPAKGLESLSESRVQSAVAKGMSPEQAERTGNAYSAALVKQLNQGVPMNEAIAQAEQVFTATESFPPPKSIQEAAVKNLAAGGNDVARQLTSLANAETSSGSAAFDQALSSSLARGMSFTDAVKVAHDAVQVADAMARADNSPQSMLANISAIGRLGNTSATFQKTLSSLMTRGYTLEEAMQRATQLAGNEAASVAADARSPSYALASGNFKALEGHATDGNFGKALSSALARGVPIDEAIVMVTKLEAQEQRAIAADARSPVAGFSSGRIVTEKSNATFDRALSNAISRGEKPDQALRSAQRASASETMVKPTIATALASGHKVESLLIGENTSRTYRMVLGNSLARGLPAAQAIALARRAENANAFRYPLNSALSRKMSGGAGNIATAGGKPLPGWLKFNPKSGEFVAFEVPPGALPMPVVIRVGKQEYKIDISEGGLRGNNKQFRTKPQI